jgi:hypothetical protein
MNELIEKLGGIRDIGIFSICLFVVVFTGSMILAFCLKKPFLKAMGELPLQDERGEDETCERVPLHTAPGRRNEPLSLTLSPASGAREPGNRVGAVSSCATSNPNPL